MTEFSDLFSKVIRAINREHELRQRAGVWVTTPWEEIYDKKDRVLLAAYDDTERAIENLMDWMRCNVPGEAEPVEETATEVRHD
jgi:hypothetical protein